MKHFVAITFIGVLVGTAHAEKLPEHAIARLGTPNLRHGGQVECVAFSKDDALLISGGFDRVVRAWSVQSGTEQFRLSGHSGWINAMAQFSDGKRLVVGGSGESAMIWNMEDRAKLKALPYRRGSIYSLAVTSDGKHVAGGGTIGDAHIWEADTGNCIQGFRESSESDLAVAFSPDGNLLASGGTRQTIVLRVWRRNKILRELRGFQKEIHVVAFSPDGSLLAAGGDGQAILVWNVESGKTVHEFQVDAPTTCVTFSRDGKLLASANGGVGHIWDLTENKRARTLEGIRLLKWLSFSHDNKQLAGAGACVQVWDIETAKPKFDPAGHEGTVRALSWSRDGKVLATGSADATVRLWNVESRKETRTIIAHKGEVDALAFSPTADLLVSGGTDKLIRIWDPAKDEKVRELPGQARGNVLAFTSDGNTLAVALDTQVNLHDPSTGEKQRSLPIEGERCTALAFSVGNRLLAAGIASSDRDKNWIELFNVKTGKRVAHIPGCRHQVTSLSFSADDRMLASVDGFDGVRIWEISSDCTSARRVLPSSLGRVQLAFSPDASLLAYSDQNGVELWQVATAKAPCRLIGHQGPVQDVVFSPDGKFLATCSTDATAMIWRLPEIPIQEVARDAEELDILWTDLGDSDASLAFRGVFSLTSSPGQAIETLRKHLAPVPTELDKLFELLDDEDFKTREKAFVEINKFVEWAAPAIKDKLDKELGSLEVRRRLERLLERVEGPLLEEKCRRGTRAIEVLERINSPEARKFLEEMAAGSREAKITLEAEAALVRVKKRG